MRLAGDPEALPGCGEAPGTELGRRGLDDRHHPLTPGPFPSHLGAGGPPAIEAPADWLGFWLADSWLPLAVPAHGLSSERTQSEPSGVSL